MTDDTPEHNQLLQLEASTLSDIETYGACQLHEKTKIHKLNTSIQAKLSQHRALSRELELLVEEVDSSEERQHVATLLTAHVNAYNTIQQALRTAAYQQRHNAVQTAAQKRSELLAGVDASTRRRQLANDSDLVAASEGITDSLRRTRQMLGEELEHTGSTLAAMEASHAQLGKTTTQYVGQHSLLSRSKGLLRTLDWQNRAETLLLWAGLAVFALVSLYVVQKRVTYFVPVALRPGTLVGKLYLAVVRPGNGSRVGQETGGVQFATLPSPVPPPLPAPVPVPVGVMTEEPAVVVVEGNVVERNSPEDVVLTDTAEGEGDSHKREVVVGLDVIAVDMEVDFVRDLPPPAAEETQQGKPAMTVTMPTQENAAGEQGAEEAMDAGQEGDPTEGRWLWLEDKKEWLWVEPAGSELEPEDISHRTEL